MEGALVQDTTLLESTLLDHTDTVLEAMVGTLQDLPGHTGVEIDSQY
jgi:hypothetical protein